ncbi:hypothetical protein JMJ77_0013260 [Colletotrichum scovillei]|uniref:Uncharacterized protein n=1 Tax=Colletotrichum scovillei TaxID=1209932 RepID=A0A9P7R756_9PEZI|nr:hypothetical protein JMJ77_0013260 [Colletotrichum scovillei]KAG7069554.1 hypothetical protein JMJ76_0003222 [Colletotrichum scovillei]KAG7073505.1 hypothetical protein JMJ78_0014479 [Colletotrichum scovillei]
MPLKDLRAEVAQKDEEKSEREEQAVYDDSEWEHMGAPIDEKETAGEECTEDKEASPPSEVAFERPERRWQGLRRQEDEAKGNVVSELLFFLAGLFLWAV